MHQLGGQRFIRQGSEAGPYLRLIDFVYHSTLVLSVIKQKRSLETRSEEWKEGYRGTSRIGNRLSIGPYCRPMPRALGWP